MSEFAESNSNRLAAMRIGVYLLGLATIFAGILDLVWGDFDPGHQPIAALGFPVPGRAIFAYIAGIWMILAGAAILWRRTVRAGALATAAIYSIFGIFSLPRLYTMSHKYGFHITLILGVFGEMLLQFIVVAGCAVLYASLAPSSITPPASRWTEKTPLVARLIFGLSGVLFGLAHLTDPKRPAHMVPHWMPFGAPFWIQLTGIFFMLAGLAILSGALNVLAARLFVLTLLVFEISLVPIVFGYPHLHQAWGASAYNLAAAGAIWIFAASIANRQVTRTRSQFAKSFIRTPPVTRSIALKLFFRFFSPKIACQAPKPPNLHK